MTATTTPAAPPSAQDQMAIAAVPAKLIAAWAAQDAAAFADLFTDDGTMMLPGVYQKGKEAIQEYMAGEYAGRFAGTRVTGQPLEIKPLAGGAVALLTEGGVLAPGETQVSAERAIRASWILVKQGGDWKLAVYHNCQRD
ncbi:MAG: SgcJ/EcaC family oxidoreductase [Hamadaea sp.]|uniref:SgcJ/EcaC family oxidoreductase n=1 Tax=Hamadaea sp. NPDC050747 TaxID=3155789 RepID=UPI00184B77E3|nr:SgcJ/EcaC family oxidoreductase [Hamadaea sp.]NUR47385.1 SgcJ/EcaC family oxidoreductase [Hamadaea sp.]NUT03515.1 SgcJ/EcaC family oxidoreductase [Hamadaea sp.]